MTNKKDSKLPSLLTMGAALLLAWVSWMANSWFEGEKLNDRVRDHMEAPMHEGTRDLDRLLRETVVKVNRNTSDIDTNRRDIREGSSRSSHAHD